MKPTILAFVFVCGAASAAGAAMAEGKQFATPQAALDAFASALKSDSHSELLEVFGEKARDLISTGDASTDAERREDVLEMYFEGYRFRPDGENLEIVLGEDGWVFPIPLARVDGQWQFDLELGAEEILYRRIGLNELAVIEWLQEYVELQAAFRQYDHDGDGVMEFAKNLIAEPETREGLFWWDEGLGPDLVEAFWPGLDDEGQLRSDGKPYYGYYYRVLDGQGDSAAGGAYSYLVGENMVAGHAILAVPYEYGETGIHTFMVNENGVIRQSDLGANTHALADEISTFEPSNGWGFVFPQE